MKFIGGQQNKLKTRFKKKERPNSAFTIFKNIRKYILLKTRGLNVTHSGINGMDSGLTGPLYMHWKRAVPTTKNSGNDLKHD